MNIRNASGCTSQIDNIGMIRCRPRRDGNFLLNTTPPVGSQFECGATLIEMTVDRDEAERIAAVAPHLWAGPAFVRQP